MEKYETFFKHTMRRVKTIYSNNSVIYIHVNTKYQIVWVVKTLKRLSFVRFDECLDLFTTNVPITAFYLRYMFMCPGENVQVMVICKYDETEGYPSIAKQFASGISLERENLDMFGFYFVDNPDLRRILTDYGFGNYPLGKTFPLSGWTTVRYDEIAKRIVKEPLDIDQAMRFHYDVSSWVPKK
jgi:NADH-quinone oxidoreductase subunit C